jgi:Fic family protein
MPDLPPLQPLTRLQPAWFVAPAVLTKAVAAGRRLAELKGLAASMSTQGILINTLALQEANDSSAIENIVTTHDELFRISTDPDLFASPAAKEVRHHLLALRVGVGLVKQTRLIPDA